MLLAVNIFYISTLLFKIASRKKIADIFYRNLWYRGFIDISIPYWKQRTAVRAHEFAL